MSMTPSNPSRGGLKKRLLDVLKGSAGSLVIASAMLASPPTKAAVNPQPDQTVSARVEKIQDQIAQPQTNAGGAAKTMEGVWLNWSNLPVWSNWSDWNNNHPWYNWGDWGNQQWHNWGDWGNQQWHNWGDWGNHHKHHDHDHDHHDHDHAHHDHD
jgi:hypothetical protein